MNSKMKNMMLPYMMLASGIMNSEVNEFNSTNSPRINVKPEWERKKCKSCKHVPTCKHSKCSVGNRWTSQQHQACEKYEKRK